MDFYSLREDRPDLPLLEAGRGADHPLARDRRRLLRTPADRRRAAQRGHLDDPILALPSPARLHDLAGWLARRDGRRRSPPRWRPGGPGCGRRAQAAVQRLIIGPGALLTVLSGLMLTFNVISRFGEPGIAGPWLMVMQGTGLVGGLLTLFVIVPTAARLARIDPETHAAAFRPAPEAGAGGGYGLGDAGADSAAGGGDSGVWTDHHRFGARLSSNRSARQAGISALRNAGHAVVPTAPRRSRRVLPASFLSRTPSAPGSRRIAPPGRCRPALPAP